MACDGTEELVEIVERLEAAMGPARDVLDTPVERFIARFAALSELDDKRQVHG